MPLILLSSLTSSASVSEVAEHILFTLVDYCYRFLPLKHYSPPFSFLYMYFDISDLS